MNRKRALSILSCAVLLLSLAGCGKTEEEPTPSAGTAVQVQAVTMSAISTDSNVSGQVLADNESPIMISAAT